MNAESQRVYRRRRLVLPDRRGRGSDHRRRRLPLPRPPGRLDRGGRTRPRRGRGRPARALDRREHRAGTYNHLLATSRNDTFFHASLALGAKSALVFWPRFTSRHHPAGRKRCGGRRGRAGQPRGVRHVDRRADRGGVSVDWARDFPYRLARARTGQPQPNRPGRRPAARHDRCRGRRRADPARLRRRQSAAAPRPSANTPPVSTALTWPPPGCRRRPWTRRSPGWTPRSGPPSRRPSGAPGGTRRPAARRDPDPGH